VLSLGTTKMKWTDAVYSRSERLDAFTATHLYGEFDPRIRPTGTGHTHTERERERELAGRTEPARRTDED